MIINSQVSDTGSCEHLVLHQPRKPRNMIIKDSLTGYQLFLVDDG
jgi:hypothetical protein